MKREEYEKELKFLYGKAIKQENVTLALEILERGRAERIEDIRSSAYSGTENVTLEGD
ncbi:hypothetical protein LCGC14_0972860 [marine sediment metagenome]|uniref:Uncharacterized protein n=1 Tax=marine sediment metagenome TaxID=412755 RepID=A0A0F9NFJ1_9ZZZZ